MTARIPPVDAATATGETAELFAAVKSKLGMVPNFYRVLGQSPVALAGYMGLNEKVGKSSFRPALREKIALAISQANACGYCLSAHTMVGSKMLKLSAEDLLRAREGQGSDERETAILSLAVKIVESRGNLSDSELATARAAGVTDVELVELITQVAAMTFSNYINRIARTPIDFPQAPNLPAEG